MFSPKYRMRAGIVLASLLALALVASSCTFEPDPKPAPAESTLGAGYWKSSYGDGFEITATRFLSYLDADKTVSFAGDLIAHRALSATSGYITVYVTENHSLYAPAEGKWYVIAWKDLSATGLSMSTPYKEGSEYNGLSTREAAETEYTIENGYFGWYADYLLQ